MCAKEAQNFDPSKNGSVNKSHNSVLHFSTLQYLCGTWANLLLLVFFLFSSNHKFWKCSFDINICLSHTFSSKISLQLSKFEWLSKLTVLSLFNFKVARKQRHYISTRTRIEKYVKLVAHTKELFIPPYECINTILAAAAAVVVILFVRWYFSTKKHPIIGLTTCVYYALRFCCWCCCCCCFSLIELDLAFWLSGFRTRTVYKCYVPNVYLSTKKNCTIQMIRSVFQCCAVSFLLLFGYLDRFVLFSLCLANKLLLVHSFVMQREWKKKNEINDLFSSPKMSDTLNGKNFVMVTKLQ